MRKKLFGDQNFVSGDLFTGASRHKATWEKIQLGALLLGVSQTESLVSDWSGICW